MSTVLKGMLFELDTAEQEVAIAINALLNPEGGTDVKFICLVCRPADRLAPGKKVHILVTSNLPYDTTEPNNVAKVLRDAANGIARPH
jgi:hypothetical protein